MPTSEPTLFIWLDPGVTTGAAWYDPVADRFASGEFTSDELLPHLESLMNTYSDHVAVGWEMYVQTSRSPGDAGPSLGEIARVRSLCRERGVRILKPQPSSARYLRGTVVFLRRLGWYRPGLGHANDAACHLFRHMIRMHPVPEKIRTRLPDGY